MPCLLFSSGSKPDETPLGGDAPTFQAERTVPAQASRGHLRSSTKNHTDPAAVATNLPISSRMRSGGLHRRRLGGVKAPGCFLLLLCL